MSIPVEEAIALAREHAVPLPEQEAPLLAALGRVLARPVLAPQPQPPFARSPLDGYAVRAADTVGATPEVPVVLQVVDKLYAGQETRVAVHVGEAVRIMTGAMLPQGADGVIRQEDTDLGEGRVRIYRAERPDRNCCHKGEEYDTGAVLLAADTKVDAAAIAVAASAGLTHLPVYRQPTAAVLSIGDEIRQPGQPLPVGKIYDSNTAYLTARLGQLGVHVRETICVGDEIPDISAALLGCEDCDLILTTGGASVGQKDLLRASVEAVGASVVFHGIAMKPGMPTLLARRGQQLLLGLSGNPFSAAVPFELLTRPILAKMTHDTTVEMQWRQAIASSEFKKNSPTRRYLRAYTNGQSVFMPTAQSNGQMRSMVGCNCLVDLPAGSGAVQQGDRVDILLL